MAKSGVLTDLVVEAKSPPRTLGMWARLTGVLTAEQLQQAYAEWEKSGESPGEVFVRHGWMTEQMVADALGELSGLPVVSKAQRSEDPDVLSALSAEEAWRLEACPLERDDQGNLVVALADPSDARLRALKQHFGSRMRPVIVLNSQLKALLDDAHAFEAAADDVTAAAEEVGEADTDVHEAEPDPPVGAADDPDDAPEPEPVDTVNLTLEPDEDPAAATEQLERLHERLASEHAQASEELLAYRQQFAEIAEEHARLQRSITALEAKVGEQELVLSLIKAKLTEPGT
jgi:hypothetical protein